MRIKLGMVLIACVSGCTTRQNLPGHLAPFVANAPAEAYIESVPAGPGKATYRTIWKGDKATYIAEDVADEVADVARSYERLPGSDMWMRAWDSIVYIVSVEPLVWLHFDGPFSYEYPATRAVVAGISAGKTLVGRGDVTLWMPGQDVYGALIQFDADGVARLVPSQLVLSRLGDDRFQVSLDTRSTP